MVDSEGGCLKPTTCSTISSFISRQATYTEYIALCLSGNFRPSAFTCVLGRFIFFSFSQQPNWTSNADQDEPISPFGDYIQPRKTNHFRRTPRSSSQIPKRSAYCFYGVSVMSLSEPRRGQGQGQGQGHRCAYPISVVQ